jgi:hypothetical protein
MYAVFFIYFVVSCTCFGCYLHPSSGAQLPRTAIGYVWFRCVIPFFFFKQTTLFMVLATSPYLYCLYILVQCVLRARRLVDGSYTVLSVDVSWQYHCAWVSWVVGRCVPCDRGTVSPASLYLVLPNPCTTPVLRSVPCPGPPAGGGGGDEAAHRMSR